MRLLPAHLVIASALVSVAAGCAPAPPQDTTAADTTAINAVRAAWVTALNAADPDALANLYTEDAVRMVYGSPTVTGRSAIRQDFADRFTMGTMTSTVRSEELQLMGDWAFDRGTFQGTMTPSGGGEVTVEGRYLVLLRRQADGSWQLARTIDNSPTPGP